MAPMAESHVPDMSNNHVPWYKQGHLIKLNYIIFSLILFSSANGYDGSLVGGLLALDTWNDFMEKPAGVRLGWITAIYWLGNGFFFPVAAWLSNRHGRKMGILVGYLFLVIGVAMQATAKTEKIFSIARLFLGTAGAWFGNSAPLLINEIAHPQHRSVASALFMCGWHFGGTICGWVVFGCRVIPSNWSWRIPVILQLAIPLVTLPGYLLAPESPRWLISVGRIDEATEIIARYQAGGDRESHIVTEQVREIEQTLTAEKEAASAASYKEVVRTPGNRRRLFISISLGFFTQWVGNNVVSYYLPLILTSVGVRTVTKQTLISACLNVWNLLWAAGASMTVDKLGRRFLFLTSGVVMLVSFIIVTGLSASFQHTGSSQVGLAVIPFLFIFYAGYDIALTPFYTAYPCEIWPFALRSIGLSFTWCSSVIALFFNTFVNPIALEAIQWKFYFMFIAVLVLLLVTVYFTYPETRGYTLEQIAFVFDGDNDAPSTIIGIKAENEDNGQAASDVEKGSRA